MSQVASLSDLQGAGPPGDIGVFQAGASVIVYPFTFSGVTYYVAQRLGPQGWVLISQGAVASTVIQAAADSSPNGLIFLKVAIYNLVNVSISTPVKFLGEPGTILNLTADSCLILTADATTVFFEEIVFRSTADIPYQIIIQNPSLKFEHCLFDFQITLDGILQGVMRCEDAANHLEFLNCELIGGKVGADYFGLVKIGCNMDELMIRDFLVTTLLVDAAAPNRVSLFEIDAAAHVARIEAENIDVKGYNCPEVVAGAFIGLHGTADSIIIDTYLFRGGVWTNGVNVYHSPLQMFDTATNVTINNMELHDRFHPIINAQRLVVNNLIMIGDGETALFDCGATDATECTAIFTNISAKDTSIDFNTGWSNLTVTGFVFEGCRINIVDEGDPTGQEKNVQIGDGVSKSIAGGKYAGQIAISYGQGVFLKKLQVTNVHWRRIDGNLIAFQPTGTPESATHWILDNINIEDKNFSWPRWLDGGGRDNDNQIIWIFNSKITAYLPPLGDWNPIRDNDRFDNVQWIWTEDGTITYSESCGKATILNGQPSVTVTHNLVSTPDYDPANDIFGIVLITGVGAAHAELHELCVNTLGAATFIIEHVGGNVTADRTVFWRASITAFA